MVANLRCAAYILGVVIAIQVGNVVPLKCYYDGRYGSYYAQNCVAPNAVCFYAKYASSQLRGCSPTLLECEQLVKAAQAKGAHAFCCKVDECNGARTINAPSWTQVLLILAVLMMINKLMI